MAQPTVEFIWKNGELLPWEAATTHVLTHALHYGSGVFEGIRAYATADGPAVFRLREHMERLERSAKMLYMDLPYSVDETCAIVRQLVAANQVDSCYIRPVVYRDYGSMGVNPLDAPVSFFVACWPWETYLGADAIEQGVAVGVSSWRQRSANALPPGIKACGAYVNSAFARVEASRNGYAEAVILNEVGHVCEGTGDNLFVVRRASAAGAGAAGAGAGANAANAGAVEIVTPPVSDGILPGITRDAVMTLARERGYTVREASLVRTELYTADEFFLTGTAAEIVPIRSVDGIAVGSGECGPITKELQTAFYEVVGGRDVAHRNWLTLV